MTICPTCRKSVVPVAERCPHCGTGVSNSRGRAHDDLEQQVYAMLQREGKIQAIKVYRELTGSSLLDSKNAVEAMEARGPVPGQGTRGTPATADWEAEAVRLLGQGQRLKAVKLYKDRMRCNLREAKQAIETLALRHGLPVEAGGCSSTTVLLLLIGVIAAIAAGVGALWLGLAGP